MSKNVTAFIVSLILILSSFNIFGQAPVITKEPSSKGVIAPQGVVFSVEASGDSLTYQWFLNDFPLGGADDSIYTIASTNTSMNGYEFNVIVSNSHGSDTSKTVFLFVTAAGNRVTASQVVQYNFKQRTGNIVRDVSTATNPLHLTINNTSAIDWSNYGLYVDNGAQIRSTSNPASSRVVDAVRSSDEMTVEMWIRPLTTASGRIIDLATSKTNINFGVENYSPNGYNYLIRTTTTNNQGIPGVVDGLGLNNNLIHLTVTHSADGVSKIYRNGAEVASDDIGGSLTNWVYSSRLSLGSFYDYTTPWEGIYYLTSIYNRALDSAEVVNNFSVGYSGVNAPFIILQPEDIGLLEGFTANFKIRAVGNGLNYQWQENGVNIPGATDSSYTIPSVILADSGNVYRIIVSNGSGVDTSDVALLEVTTPIAECPDDIIHYYPLEESSSPYNDAIGFADGTSSTPPAIVPGIVGNAQNFSEDKIDISDDISFDWASNENFSMELWMNTSSALSGTVVLLGRDASSGNLQWWIGLSSNGRALFDLHSPSEGVTVGDKSPDLNDGAWHHIVAVRDERINKNYLYVDGNKIDSVIINYTASFESNAQITLGYLNITPFYYYSGSIDEVAFYSAALSDSDILEHYNKGLAGFGACEIPPTISAPTNLIALLHPADTSKVDLTWEDNSPDELGFIIQRATGESDTASAFAVIDTVDANIESFTDFSTDTSTTYTYRVYAYNDDTVSVFSNLAEITTKVPVELTSFTVSTQKGIVTIYWETATETNNSGFAIERKSDDGIFEEIAFIKGKGTTTDKSTYSYTDKAVLYGKYSYRLRQIDFDGSYSYSKVLGVDLVL